MLDISSLRHASCQAVGSFHRWQGEFFTALSRGGISMITEAADKALLAGEMYKTTLIRLLDKLTSPENAGVNKDELIRTVQLLNTLESDLSLLHQHSNP